MIANDTVKRVRENLPEKVGEMKEAPNDFVKNFNLFFSV